MIHLYNKNKVKLAGLIDYKNLSIEKVLESGDKTLSFSYPKKANYYFDIEEECYIRTKEDEFVVKEKNVGSKFTGFKCSLNLEDLEGRPFEKFESKEQPIDKALDLALSGTGWVVGACDLKKKRTVRMTNCSSLEIVQEIKKIYRCDIVFNTLSKTIDVYEHLGEDKGTYFIDSLNLEELGIQGNSYDYYTRIIPIGKDDLRITDINNGKEYVENYQYSNKIKTVYWKDDRYTVIENLKADAESKLEEISKPYRAYSAKILNLAKLNNKYKNILDYKLGDTITLISKEDKFKDKQRIVKIIEFPDEHEKDSIELANTTLCFEDIQTQFQEAAGTVENITTDNGTIDGSTVDSIKTEQISDFETSVAKITDLTVVNAKVINLEAQYVTISGQLTAVNAQIGTLTTNVATIDKLVVKHDASITNLNANKANITDLNATNATIQVLEANVGNIRTLVNGNLSSENIQVGGITGDRLNMKTIFVDDANILSVNANKINTGEINTNKVKIKSDDGGIEIVGATQQFKDKNNKVRIQMGKDAKGDFNFIILGEDGTTTLIDHTGVKEKAIANDLIKSNMIASNAVGEKQIDYSSFSEGFNKDTNTHTLNATKIKLNNQNQTLDIAFNQLKTQSDETKSLTESHSTTIGVIQGQISTAINNTQIVKDGKIVLLKDDYNRTVETVDALKSTIGKHTTLIDQQTGLITGVTSKVNNFERDLNGMSLTVSETKTKLDNLQIGVRNFLVNSNFKKGLAPHTVKNSNNPGNITVTTLDGQTCCYFQNIKYWNETKYLTVSQTPYDVEKGYIISMDIYAINPAPLAIDTTGVIDAEDRSVPATSARKWQRVSVYIPPHSGRNLSGYTSFSIYALKNHTFTGYITNIKVEHGNTPTGWNQAPEDIEEQITTTNNKVSIIESNLTSITSRVSSVETTTSNLNGNMTNLNTRMNLAEQKITDSSIVSIVSSQFYKKDETNALYASKTQFIQLDNKFEFTITQAGGKNYIRNSQFIRGTKYWGNYNSEIVNIPTTDYNWLTRFMPNTGIGIRVADKRQGTLYTENIQIETNSHYSVSLDAFVMSNVQWCEVWIEEKRKDGSIIYSHSVGTVSNSERFGGTIHVTNTECRYLTIVVKHGGVKELGKGNDVIYINNVKLEQGNHITKHCGNDDELYVNNVSIDTTGFHVVNRNGSSANLSADGFNFTDNQGNKALGFDNGGFTFHTTNKPEFVAFMKSSTYFPGDLRYNGVNFMMTEQGDYIAIGANDVLDESVTEGNPYIFILRKDIPGILDNKKAIYFLELPIISKVEMFCDKQVTMQDQTVFNRQLVIRSNEEGLPHVLHTHNPTLNIYGHRGVNLGLRDNGVFYNGLRIVFSGDYSNKCYGYIDMDIDFHNQYYIKNAHIVNSTFQASYSLMATSPGVSVGADTSSVETMLLQEDFSEYDEKNNAVIVNMNEAIKSVYANNKKLESENAQLKQENETLNKELETTKNALDEILMNAV